MEILQLKYFLNTARKENISHTAQFFRVPPSSVSAAIKKLERELGVKLFDRTANSLKLNANGRIFLRAVENAEKELKKAKVDMLNLLTMPYGEINLLILTNRRIVTDVIAKFKLDYPEVNFIIKHENYDDYSNYKKFDIIISDRRIELDSFENKHFVREEVFLAVHSGSPLAEHGGVQLKNLRNEKFICMPKGSSIRDFMDRCFKKLDFEPQIVIECDDPQYIREYTKMGLGVTFFPYVSWNKQIDNRVKLLRINDGVYRNSYIYTSRESSAIAKIFAETLELSLHGAE